MRCQWCRNGTAKLQRKTAVLAMLRKWWTTASKRTCRARADRRAAGSAGCHGIGNPQKEGCKHVLTVGGSTLVQEGLEDALPVLRHKIGLEQRHAQVVAHPPRVLRRTAHTSLSAGWQRVNHRLPGEFSQLVCASQNAHVGGQAVEAVHGRRQRASRGPGEQALWLHTLPLLLSDNFLTWMSRSTGAVPVAHNQDCHTAGLASAGRQPGATAEH